MKTYKNPAEERENLLIQAQNLYKQKYEKFPEEEGYKIHHIDNKEIIFATSADSLKAYLKHKHRDKHFLIGIGCLMVVETAIFFVCYYLCKNALVSQYLLGIVIFLIVWVVMFSGIAVQQHNIDNYNLRMKYHKQIVSVKPQKQKIKLK